MKYLKLFETFENRDFPDVFGHSLIRGSKVDKDSYIDNPKLRRVSIGSQELDDYRLFLENYANLGLQDPTKSVHFYLNPTSDRRMVNWYGKAYRLIPEKDAKFSYNRELRNGGLGSTWYFVESCLRDWLKTGRNYENIPKEKIEKYFKSFRDIKSLSNLEEIFNDDRDEFLRLISGYQKWLMDDGVIGNLTYNELLELSKKGEPTLQVWTESPVMHISWIEPPKSPKEP